MNDRVQQDATDEQVLDYAREEAAKARDGAKSLRHRDLTARLGYLRNLSDIILRRREEILDRIQQDTGKSRSDALVSEIFGALDVLAWTVKFAPKHLAHKKVHTPITLMGKKSEVWFEPLGTVLVISPWNYPFYQAIAPIALAFACGNTILYKPSEWTPLTGLIEDLLAEAQFAPNWVRVVYGDGRVGAALIDQRPEKVMFTGSTRTGKIILQRAAEQMIPVELELGGKDAMIVFDDADIVRAAAGAAWGGLTCTGQSCTSVERLYVHEAIYDRFRDALVGVAKGIKQETDKDGDADIGAMTTPFQVKIVREHVESAVAAGAKQLTGTQWDGESALIPPIVLDDVTEQMTVARAETFGPVLPLLRFTDEDDVIARANDSEFGLTASVWTKDLTRARRVAAALTVGGVSINNVMATEANPALPFGGVRNSGFGRYKGEIGLHTFCNVKSVLVDKNSNKIEANWFPYTRRKYELFSDMTVNFFSSGAGAFVRFLRAALSLESYADKAGKKGR